MCSSTGSLEDGLALCNLMQAGVLHCEFLLSCQDACAYYGDMVVLVKLFMFVYIQRCTGISAVLDILVV